MSIESIINQGLLEPNIIKNIERTINDLYLFYMKFIASEYDPKVEAPHIKELSEYLMDIYRGNINKLCVAMPPRHSKSSMVTLAFPMWLIFHNPNLKILIVNAEAGLSETFGIRIREEIKRYGEWFNIYLSDKKHANTHIMFENREGHLYNGFIRLTGSNGSITGQDADYLIIDDPYKSYMELTPTLLNKKIEWFKSMILQRLEVDSKLIILHTRFHTEDLQGYLMKNHPEEYTFISYPAITPDGLPLWKERHNIEFLNNKREEMGERIFNSIYQQTPLDEEGDFFPLDKIRWVDEIFKPAGHTLISVRSWDLAYSDETKGKKNDSTAGVLMHRTEDGLFIVSDIKHGQYGDRLKQVLIETARRDTSAVPVLIESGTVGGASRFLFNEYKDYLKGFRCIQSEPIGSKQDRAYPLKQAILDGKVQFNILDERVREELIIQLKGFPFSTKHDDIIDALSYAYTYLKGSGGECLVATGEYRRRIRIGNTIGGGSRHPHPRRNRKWNFI